MIKTIIKLKKKILNNEDLSPLTNVWSKLLPSWRYNIKKLSRMEVRKNVEKHGYLVVSFMTLIPIKAFCIYNRFYEGDPRYFILE